MNTDWLQSFIEAARQKSLSKAAYALNLSQPAISKHIRNLEHHYNVVLFHRTSSGIELTEAGEHFHTRIAPVFTELLDIHQEMREYDKTAPIALGTLPSLATYYLPQRMNHSSLPDQVVSVMIQNTSVELVHSLKEGRLDAVLVDQGYVTASLWKKELFNEGYYAVFPLNHPFHSRSSIKLADLNQESLLVHQSPCDTRTFILAQFDAAGYRPLAITEVASGDFIFGAVAAGMGITIVPELNAQNLGHLQLFALPIEDLDGRRSITLIAQDAQLGSKLYNWITSYSESATK
ncbi:LysR family transcriptional regulator [Paenibacillus arenosi]|uniref:LysR family transcriptional regulator n=1 Tax=Paenibacillus arenosi TaxID=2774142 RepID=A0ABR9B070_9BACL|nr:LysR family transcriptional regulator [Paenibacillus arenosi]MBD8499294.1 LysR family transcriptional regulator [Paenibacillus arenosi]